MYNKATIVRKFKRKPIQWTRNTVQLLFSFFLLYVGWKFYQFYNHFASMGVEPFVERPGAVEGFLPISSLVAFKVWVTTGQFDMIHPAGLVLFTIIVFSSILFRKAFCGWLCPVGTMSEFLGKIGKNLFKKQFEPPKWLSVILSSLKYLLLIAFAKVIIFDMPIIASIDFINSPYNKIADIKMMLFFLEISAFSLKVIVILMLLSLFIKNFWCRFLCPYGALIGLGSLFQLSKIKRNELTCIDCNQCTRACPQGIKVAQKKAVMTPECTACFSCIEACPVKDTLNMTVATKKVNKWVIPSAFLAVFFGAIIVAKLTGHWQSTITYQDFQELIPLLDYIGH
ncbi:4Fe-4S binding protein [Calidifontibacillus oryziterrae]|uniref:4Fe-4S binding protein n=1 Tax=Calidifontibacillus oryziterrae TaxID=1191699 RepID=UPI000308329F|nr:4Fe-4S binding protein [Calidifontibacillus oryziterrae]